MEIVDIKIPEGKIAEWVDGVLTLVDDTPKDITERVKTYEDACKELGIEPINSIELTKAGFTKDEIAYRKLKTITKALNEGWVPNWNNNNVYKFWPYFKYDHNTNKFTYLCLGDAVESIRAAFHTQLCFRSQGLAVHAGLTFIDLYNDYLLAEGTYENL